MICEDAGQAAKIDKVRSGLPDLEHVILIDPDGDPDPDPAGDDGHLTIDALREQSRGGDRAELDRRCAAVAPGDPYTIIYTSGTTGAPKGVVLSHGNCASVGVMCQEIGFVTEEDLSYLYLPLAHVFALTVQLASFDVGTGIVYWGGGHPADHRRDDPDLPTYFPSVPRIFEKLYALALSMAESEEQLRGAVEVGSEGSPAPRPRRSRPGGAERGLRPCRGGPYGKVRGLFGGKLEKAVSGAAPICVEILEFFYACGVPVLEGWGMTETTALGTVNTLEHMRLGTVGRALPGVELKIADDGEILIKGPNVFREYWRNPDATRETFTDDGWLQTGDLGSIDDDGYMTITGRKKDIIITAGGKNLTPANLKNDLKQSRWVSQAVMYGDRRPYPVALITLDPDEIAPWAKERGLPEDMASLVQADEIKQLIQEVLDRANAKYAQVEQIKKFALLDHDLTQEGGELTPTLKLKRNVVSERYADVFEGLYG